MIHEPNASLADAAALIAGLLLARHLLLLCFGGRRPTEWAARWLRRGVVVAGLVPALRLFALASQYPPGGTRILLAGLAIMGGGALLLVADHLLTRRRHHSSRRVTP